MTTHKDKFSRRFQDLAQRYYGTRDLGTLTPRQLNQITNWATNVNPDERARTRGRKYSGNTYRKLKGIFN